MGSTKSGNEVIFEGLDCPFGPVASMEAGGRELKFNVFVGDELFEELGGFIVQSV